MFQRIFKLGWVVGLAVLVACAANATPEQKIVGRWQRLSGVGPGDPQEISGEYIEFRADGALLWLIKDRENFWLATSGTYAVPTADEIEVTGNCYRGYERFTCTKTFALELEGEALKITGELGLSEYQRIGEAGQTVPAELPPPFATAVP